METPTRQPTPRTPKQNPEIKGNPYAATYTHEEFGREATYDVYRVLSASGGRPYETEVATSPDNPDYDRCSCKASGTCWHRSAARLRRLIDRQTRGSECFYATWGIAELIDEGARLNTVLAEADSWLVRAQLGVVGDAILDRLNRREAA